MEEGAGDRRAAGGQRALEASERVAPALGVRVVRREQVQRRIGLRGEPADVLERVRREAQLGGGLLGRQAVELGEPRLRALPDRHGMVEAPQHRRHPAGAHLDDPAAQVRVALEHAVEDEHGHEPLGRLVDDHEVLRADHLGARHLLGRRATVVHPLGADRQRPAADVEHERHAVLGQAGPERVVVGMARAPARRERGPGSTPRAARAPARRRARPATSSGRRGRRWPTPRRRCVGVRRTRPSPGCGPGRRRSGRRGRRCRTAARTATSRRPGARSRGGRAPGERSSGSTAPRAACHLGPRRMSSSPRAASSARCSVECAAGIDVEPQPAAGDVRQPITDARRRRGRGGTGASPSGGCRRR